MMSLYILNNSVTYKYMYSCTPRPNYRVYLYLGDVARFYEIPLEWQSIPLHIQSVFMMSKSKRKVVPLSPLDYIYPHLRPEVGEKSWRDNRELLQSIPRRMMEFDQPMNFQTDNYSPECSFSRMDNTGKL